jgi:protein-tyrosine phosphatase
VIDLHSHPLPGLDDGVPDLASGVELVRAAAKAGVACIAATPHVRIDFPTTAADVENGVLTLREAIGSSNIKVSTGAEISAAYLQRLTDEDLVRLTLGGSGRYLLVELPTGGWSIGMELAFQRLAELHIQPILAHPERSVLVRKRPARLVSLVDAGALVQVTARATVGQGCSSDTVKALLRLGLVHVVASDAHRAPKFGERSPWEVNLPDALLERLCISNPAAILEGADTDRELRRPRPVLRRMRYWR